MHIELIYTQSLMLFYNYNATRQIQGKETARAE